MKRIAITSALLMALQFSFTAPVNYELKSQGIKNLNSVLFSTTAYAADTDYTWNNVIPEKFPAPGKGNGKLVLFDNSHGETAGQADWVIDGGFSDFADDLVKNGYTVREYRGVDKNTDGAIRYFDDRNASNVDKNEAVITYEAIKNADVFIMAEANRPFTISERAALKRFVDDGKGIYFIADHYNADRNMNTWDSTEVYNGYNRSAADAYNMDGIYGDLRNTKDANKGWLAENFGIRFRFNAIDLLSGVSDVKLEKDTEGITKGVKPILMAAGSTLAVVDGNKAKGLVYFSDSDKPAKWGNAADKGLYFGGAKEGAYVAISKPSKGKAAFIGDSSPIEDITTKYKNEGSGKSKSTHNGYMDNGNAAVLSVNIVNWLSNTEDYVGFDGVNHTKGINTVEPMIDIEKSESQAEPWARPSYEPWNTDTYATGAYNAPKGPMTASIKVTGVTLDQSSVIINSNKTVTLVANVQPSNASSKTVNWSSSDESIAIVSNGIVTGKAVGDAVITATTLDGAKTSTCTVKVTNDNIPKVSVTGVTLSNTSLDLSKGNSIEVVATVAPSNATDKSITWESSNAAVATVNKGVVTAVSNGTAIIKAITVDGKISASCNVNVTTPVAPNFISEGFDKVQGSKDAPISGGIPEGWTLASSLQSLSTAGNFGAAAPSIAFKGNAEMKTPIFDLKAPATLSFWIKGNSGNGTGSIGTLLVEKFDGTNWSTVESISMKANNGETKTYKLEQNVVQVRFAYTKNYSNILIDDVKVTPDAVIVVKPTSISLDKTSLSLNKDEVGTLKAAVLPENTTNKKVLWTSSDDKVVKVNNGVITAVAGGTATITATTEVDALKASCEVTVVDNVIYLNNAEIVSDTIPTVMEGGKAYSANVVVKNTGNRVWSLVDNYKLGAIGDSDPFAEHRVNINDKEVVAPGATKTFTINMVAPIESGDYISDWGMVQEAVEWFGKTLTKNVKVNGILKPNNAEILENNIAETMEALKTYNVSINVKNTGSNTWTSDTNFKLGAVGDSDDFTGGRVTLEKGETIATGQTKTFNFVMTAPAEGKAYKTDWRMVQEEIEWFGGIIEKNVNVIAAPVVKANNAEILNINLPQSMEAGKEYTVSIEVKNIGTSTWTADKNFKLGGIGDSDPFAFPRVMLESNDSIAPGQTKVFTFKMVAPLEANTYISDWGMLQEEIEWFGASTIKTITVK